MALFIHHLLELMDVLHHVNTAPTNATADVYGRELPVGAQSPNRSPGHGEQFSNLIDL
jgi:hypothetical protein